MKKIVQSLAVDIPIFALYGVVIPFMWSWFIVPLGMPNIGFWHAIGLMMALSVLVLGKMKYNGDKDKDKEEVDLVYTFLYRGSRALFAWGCGAIIHFFAM